jgi:hypothetical protein
MAQERIDRGEQPGLPSAERAELLAAQRRIRELETELDRARANALCIPEQWSPHLKATTKTVFVHHVRGH